MFFGLYFLRKKNKLVLNLISKKKELTLFGNFALELDGLIWD